MIHLQEQEISCPYCGEMIEVLLNREEIGGSYIEDCQVCCRSINFIVFEDENHDLNVTVSSDYD